MAVRSTLQNAAQVLASEASLDTGDHLRRTGGYQLAAARGRVLFPHPSHPFTPGDAYAVKIDGPNRRLLIDLSVKL